MDCRHKCGDDIIKWKSAAFYVLTEDVHAVENGGLYPSGVATPSFLSVLPN